MTVIINFESISELDNAIIPDAIYQETIHKEKMKIQDYFILHPELLFSFVGYNGALKLANQLSSQNKCGCYYKIPWITYYSVTNHTENISLSFSQQVEEYRYMILHWHPSPDISNMQYLSQIALTMILDIKQFWYYTQNNLETCTLSTKKYYTDHFPNKKKFLLYIAKYLSKIK